MTAVVALLRAVNLGGDTVVRKEDLEQLAVSVGGREAQTLLQSGNVVFRYDVSRSPAELEAELERAIASRFARPTDVFVRTAGEWGAIRAENPFPREAKEDPAHLVVTTLKAAPSAAAVRALQASIAGRERIAGRGREAYIVYPDGIGRSKLTATRIEAALGSRGTSRNWNTVGRIADALALRA